MCFPSAFPSAAVDPWEHIAQVLPDVAYNTRMPPLLSALSWCEAAWEEREARFPRRWANLQHRWEAAAIIHPRKIPDQVEYF